GNRLTSTSAPGETGNQPFSETYEYDAHGNVIRMPHLPKLVWDEHDRLVSTTRQVTNAGVPETTYYGYDAAGNRQWKTTDKQANVPLEAVRRRSHIYLGNLEIDRRYSGNGKDIA